MPQTFAFDEIGRLPMPGDNAAIAIRRLEAGTLIRWQDTSFALDHTVLEGHRFAVRAISEGQALLSWELPFGVALAPIAPGAYVCNHGVLEALRIRQLDFALPEEPNFADQVHSYHLDEPSFHPGQQLPLHEQPGTFMGYDRGSRGVGTRNHIALIGTSSRTASFVRLLAERFRGKSGDTFDGVVALGHTEGGTATTPNNQELLLRTLAGWMVHSNVGAVLAVDYGTEAVTNRLLQDYLTAHHYPLDQVLHRFLSLSGGLQAQLAEAERIVGEWLDPVSRARRTHKPLAHLKIALQCGGSDAFSGVSANPLIGWVAGEVVRHGGAANLAETDELIGAESYVLEKVRDLETARRFLHMVERFQERAAWHGTSAEGNPSGGNKYRGLYNIVLKSIGAARKRDPRVRLDYAIDYGAPMEEPGYCFMDSPGNDLESIAGQVASGCNLIYFTTGNGSITNFPFVPTIKVVTTTRRFELLSRDMDFNAGAYLEGTPMEDLGRQLFELTLEVISGTRSVGEGAGHSQVSIWRNWPQRDASQLEHLKAAAEPEGIPLLLNADTPIPPASFSAIQAGTSHATDQLGLILPTSLCAGQVARLAAERLNAKGLGRQQGISRFAALVHTEGCGVSGSHAEHLYDRTLIGYLTHPLVKVALLLEHGCEKTHNDYFRTHLEELGVDPGQFGWASVQLDGGIEKSLEKVEEFFERTLGGQLALQCEQVGLDYLSLGLLSAGPLADPAAAALARLTRWVVGAGGTVVMPANAGLLQSPVYLEAALGSNQPETSLAHGQSFENPGFYIMDTPTDHWVETLTGLGATGVELMLTHAGEHPMQGHPLVPLVQVSGTEPVLRAYRGDLDLALEGEPEGWSQQLLQLLLEVASRRQSPKALAQGNIDFQITRGLLGISM
ncbi:MAG: UxaA family hydrolase [Candidatus Latescibacteria bacterium]|nr:UxaA family hydrolase [Candidatus Latescibacterota bacterium]